MHGLLKLATLFKIIKGIYDPTCVPHFDFVDLSQETIRTRCHKYKLVPNHCYYGLRKYNFTNRVKYYMTTTQISMASGTVVLLYNNMYSVYNI